MILMQDFPMTLQRDRGEGILYSVCLATSFHVNTLHSG